MEGSGGPWPERVAILGLGLMGASLGLALRAAGLARTVTGYDATQGVAERARERGAISAACASMREAVRGADLVVLAVPVVAMRPLLTSLAEVNADLAPEVLVTDLGSTKSEVLAWAADALPTSVRFVGGHPMTGRESSGVDAATATLYAGCTWCLTPSAETDPRAVAMLTTLIERLGARPLTLSAEAHDHAVAAISHLPLLAATALITAVSQRADWDAAQRLAAGGFRDTTRVAAGDPRMARDICLTNTSAILDALDGYIAELQTLRALLATHNTSLEDYFAQAQAVRRAWPPH